MVRSLNRQYKVPISPIEPIEVLRDWRRHPPRVQLRPLSAEDYASCLLLWSTCDQAPLRAWLDPTTLMRLIERNPCLCMAAERDERLVGALLAGHDGVSGWLYHVAVDESSRHQGIGNMLLSRALDDLSRCGVRWMHAATAFPNLIGTRFLTNCGWHLRNDLGLMSIELRSPLLN